MPPLVSFQTSDGEDLLEYNTRKKEEGDSWKTYLEVSQQAFPLLPHLSPCPDYQSCFLPTPCTLMLDLLPHNPDACEVHQPVMQNESQIWPLLALHCQCPGPATTISFNWKAEKAFTVVSCLPLLPGFILHTVAK